MLALTNSKEGIVLEIQCKGGSGGFIRKEACPRAGQAKDRRPLARDNGLALDRMAVAMSYTGDVARTVETAEKSIR